MPCLLYVLNFRYFGTVASAMKYNLGKCDVVIPAKNIQTRLSNTSKEATPGLLTSSRCDVIAIAHEWHRQAVIYNN